MLGMKPIGEIRQQRLKQFLEQTGLTYADMNAALGRNRRDATLNQIAKAAKNTSTGKPRRMGDSQARLLETKFGLPAGWFDSDPETTFDLISRTPTGEIKIIDVAHIMAPKSAAKEDVRSYNVPNPWPFQKVSRAEVEALDAQHRELLERVMLAVLNSQPAPHWPDAARAVAAKLDKETSSDNFSLFLHAVAAEMQQRSVRASTKAKYAEHRDQ